jgi:hypothetical protein
MKMLVKFADLLVGVTPTIVIQERADFRAPRF